MRRPTAALLVLTTAISACGLLTPDELSQSDRGDVVSGFVEGPGIEVCFGDQRIVSASQSKDGPLSLCLGSAMSPKACEGDTSCASGERCVCGRCTTRPCRTATECEGREVCRSNRCAAACTGEQDCGPGEICNSGGCARPCSSDEACAFGEKCSAFDGTCAVKLCSATVSCSGDDVCVEQERVADLREPHLVRTGAEVVGFVELREGVTHDCAVYRVRIDSPRRWVVEPPTAVLEPLSEDGGCVGAPSVLLEDGAWTLYASRGDGSGIVRAQSVDGSIFSRDAAPVLVPSEPWEEGRVASPAIVRWHGESIMAYEGGPGAGIGLARIDAEGHATRLTTGAWLTPADFEDPVMWRYIERIGSPFVVERDGALLVYLTVRGMEGSDAVTGTTGGYPADPNDSIGLVATRDLVEVERFVSGPVFARRTNLRAYLGEAEPSVLLQSSGSWLVFAASDASGRQRTGLGLATAGP